MRDIAQPEHLIQYIELMKEESSTHIWEGGRKKLGNAVSPLPPNGIGAVLLIFILGTLLEGKSDV